MLAAPLQTALKLPNTPWQQSCCYGISSSINGAIHAPLAVEPQQGRPRQPGVERELHRTAQLQAPRQRRWRHEDQLTRVRDRQRQRGSSHVVPSRQKSDSVDPCPLGGHPQVAVVPVGLCGDRERLTGLRVPSFRGELGETALFGPDTETDCLSDRHALQLPCLRVSGGRGGV